MPRRALVAAAILVAGACGGGGGSSTESTEASAGTAVDAGDAVVGGVLRLGVERLASFDPADADPGSASASITADLLYDGLTDMGDRAAVPGLAARWSTPDGGTTWRFTLREGAVFADGAPVEAADAAASIGRAVARGLPGLQAVADVAATADGEVQVVLREPEASLPEVLAAPALGIARVSAGGAIDPSTGGTGPLRIAGVEGDVVHLVRGPGSSAYLDGVDLHQFDDLGAAYDAFVGGSLDWSLVPADRAEAAAEDYGSDGFVPFQAEVFLGFNLADPAFADVRFRQAVATAIDREAVVGAVYFGVADPLSTIVPAGVPGHDPARCGDGCAYDPERSARLLAQVAGESGAVPTVVLDFEDTPVESALAQVVQDQLERAGIPVTLRPHPPAEFDAFAVSGEQALARLGWVGTAPTAESYVEPQFETGSPDNVTGFSSVPVDVLLAAADTTVDASARADLVGQAEEAVLTAAPVVPLAQLRLLSVASPTVRGLRLAVDGTFDATAVWLDP